MDLGKLQRAAVSVFAERGFAAAGIRELGSAAGINSATLYHYAGSKEELLLGIMRTCLREMIATGSAALRASSEPALQIAHLLASHVGFTATNRLTARVAEYEMRALSPANRPTMQGLRDEYESLFAQVLERGARVGAFKVGDLSLTRLALLEMGTGTAHWYSPDGRLPLPLIQAEFVSMAFRVLAVDPTVLDGISYLQTPPLLPSEPLTPHSEPVTQASA